MGVSVCGLGKLGLPMAAVYAKHGFDVLGIDNNERVVNEIRDGGCPVVESGLQELISVCGDTVKVSNSYDGVAVAEIIFIIVPTPSDDTGAFSNRHVLSAVRSIGEEVKRMGSNPLVVVTSTVMPGSCEEKIMTELETSAGRTLPFCYNPEFIALGSVIRDLEHPDAILIGESDKYAGDKLAAFYYKLHGCNPPPIARMSLCNAELAKIALNTFVTTKISLANTYAMICSQMPQGDVDAITEFLGLDSRIGRKYLKGGLGFSGECFGRDNRAFGVFAEQLNMDTPLQSATDKVNKMVVAMVVEKVKAITEKNKGNTLSVLGLTFKPNTPVTTESQSLEIAQILSKYYTVKVHDPMGMANAKAASDGCDIVWSESAFECLANSDLCILATPWAEYERMTPGEFKNVMNSPVIYDCWRIWDRNRMKMAGIEYYALGLNE